VPSLLYGLKNTARRDSESKGMWGDAKGDRRFDVYLLRRGRFKSLLLGERMTRVAAWGLHREESAPSRSESPGRRGEGPGGVRRLGASAEPARGVKRGRTGQSGWLGLEAPGRHDKIRRQLQLAH